MRSYGQHCALAKALDVVGDRWTLLIVRELSLRPCRYTDLRDGLPGIATNLLADRLRALEESGVVEREEAPPPSATTLYRLTERGADLLPAVAALTRWGAPLMTHRSRDDEFRTRWIAFALRSMLDGVDVASLAPLTVVAEVDGEELSVVVTRRGVRVVLGTVADDPDVVVRADSDTMFGLIGGLDLEVARRRRSVELRGDAGARARLAELLRRAVPASLGSSATVG